VRSSIDLAPIHFEYSSGAKVKFILAVAAVVAFVAPTESGNRSQAGDGAPPVGKTVAPTAADANSLPAGAERELLKQIQRAWRKREERLQSLLLVYVMNVTDEHLRDRQRAARARHPQLAPRVPDAAKNGPQAAPAAAPAGPAKMSYVHLFATRQNSFRSERWDRLSEKEARALLGGLTPGKDCDYASIEAGDRRYILDPNVCGRDGTRFREIAIVPRINQIAMTPIGKLLLLNYRSSLLAPSEGFRLESARLTVVPKKGTEPSRVVVSLPRFDISLDPSRDYLVTEILSWRQDRSQEITRTACEYEKAPAPLDWVPKKFTATWFPWTTLGNRTEDCVTVDWGTGDDKVPNDLFEFGSPDGTFVIDQTEDNGQTTKVSIAWRGKLVPVNPSRLYSESLKRVKQGQPEDGK
jgi:hypothetical protein